jgi:hypothetical protein
VNRFIVFGGNEEMTIHGCALLPWRKVSGMI